MFYDNKDCSLEVKRKLSNKDNIAQGLHLFIEVFSTAGQFPDRN